MFTFPRVCKALSFEQQADKVREEVAEALEATGEDKDMEALDVLHAAEMLVRIQFEGRENLLEQMVMKVITKNSLRGKYSNRGSL